MSASYLSYSTTDEARLFILHRVFLPQLEQCSDDHIAVASCFVNHARQLEMYVNYCTYQAKSDSVFKEYCSFFAVSVTTSCLCDITTSCMCDITTSCFNVLVVNICNRAEM